MLDSWLGPTSTSAFFLLRKKPQHAPFTLVKWQWYNSEETSYTFYLKNCFSWPKPKQHFRSFQKYKKQTNKKLWFGLNGLLSVYRNRNVTARQPHKQEVSATILMLPHKLCRSFSKAHHHIIYFVNFICNHTHGSTEEEVQCLTSVICFYDGQGCF